MSFGLSFKQLLRLVAMLVSQVLFLWVAATWATPLSFTEADSEAMSDQALAEAYLRQQQGATTTLYAAAQQLYFDQRRTAKRGPPTPGFSSTGLTTPLGSEPTAPAPEEASGSQATPPAQGFASQRRKLGLILRTQVPFAHGWEARLLRAPQCWRRFVTTTRLSFVRNCTTW